MFRELMPLLKERSVMMTLSRVDDQTIRVCVIPKRIKEETKEATKENALCSPLAVTATVDELDRDFAGQLTRYSDAVIAFGANFAEIEAAHQAATKALKEENKKDLDRQRGKGTTKGNPSAAQTQGPVIKDGKPVFGSKDGVTSSPAPTLFDAPAPPNAVPDSEATSTRPAEPPQTRQAAPNDHPAADVSGDTVSPLGIEQSTFHYPD